MATKKQIPKPNQLLKPIPPGTVLHRLMLMVAKRVAARIIEGATSATPRENNQSRTPENNK